MPDTKFDHRSSAVAVLTFVSKKLKSSRNLRTAAKFAAFRSYRKHLSFDEAFVASEFPTPAWRNWQTRWTQNPVIARSCGFEPLRRQSQLANIAIEICSLRARA